MTPLMKVARKVSASTLMMLVIFTYASCRAQPVTRAESQVSATPKLTVTVPDVGWRLKIERIFERENEIWVLAQLERKPGMAAQMITQAEATMPVALPKKALKVFIAGKTWNWKNSEAYEFVPALAPIVARAGTSPVLFPASQ